MKSISSVFKISVFVVVWIFFQSFINETILAQTGQNNNNYHVYKGIVLDSAGKHPLVFASVFVEETNIGTVTNPDGRFLIKIPDKFSGNNLGISMMGYRTRYLNPEKLRFVKNRILL